MLLEQRDHRGHPWSTEDEETTGEQPPAVQVDPHDRDPQDVLTEARAVTAPRALTDGGEDVVESIDTREQIHTGVSITAKIKRGTGTRDQDEINLKAKGRDAEHAAAQMDRVLDRAEEWSEQLREVQPDAGDAGVFE